MVSKTIDAGSIPATLAKNPIVALHVKNELKGDIDNG
jgi:hypothetical protein